jgi:hypothetical protein
MARAALRSSSKRDTSAVDFTVALDPITDAEERARAARRTLMEYADLMPEPNIGPLRFDDFPFQVEWYSEEVADAEEVVLRKGAQVGASGYGIRWCIQRVDQYRRTGLYVMPGDEHVRAFGDERIEPAIEESNYLQTRIRGKFVRNKHLKRIGSTFLHLRGSNSKAGAQSIAAQFVFLDERDLLDQTNVPHIERRISGARQLGMTPQVRHAGYPLLPNTGIDLIWQSSDQRVWHVLCRECGDEQPITWEGNVRWTTPGYHEGESEENPKGDPELPLRVMRAGTDAFEDRKSIEDVWRQCRSCGASLEDSSPGAKDGALRSGDWIPMRPGAKVIGFHVWRGMVPTTDLGAMVVASRGTSEAEREAFAALDLGLPYSQGDASLSDEDLARACSFGIPMVHRYVGSNPTTMGVDVAGERDLNVQIDEQLPAEHPGVPNPRRTLWAGTCSTFEQVADLIQRFGVQIVAIDSNPERRMAKALRSTFPGRVFLVEYGFKPQDEPLKITMDEAGMPLKVRVNRTDAIDAMMDSVRQVRWRPPANPPPGWQAQMKSLHRVTSLDKNDVPVRTYVTTGTDGDDYAHAATFGLVATELWRMALRVQAELQARAGRVMSQEEMGFRGVRLASDDDRYEPGFGGGE